MLKGYTKDGKRVIGVYELIPATTLVRGRAENGELFYCGESTLVWDASEIQREGNQIIFVDEDFRHVLESEVEWT